MLCRIQTGDFDTAAELAALAARAGDAGAIASFTGRVRAGDGEHRIERLTLEHYPGMTEAAIDEILAQASRRFAILDATVIHRVGTLVPGDSIVLVAVASAHRGDAFRACEFLIDWLKTRAPFWKKESGPAGTRWVDARASDDAAAARWGEASPE